MPNPPSYVNPYDPRIGNGGLPPGIGGSENRAYTYTPQEGQTSMGLLNRYTANGSPYIRQAERGAANQAASRGLLNSSIAAGAGRRAAIESAGQFALADAQMNNQAQLKNVDWLNERQIGQENGALSQLIASTAADNRTYAANAEREAALQLQRERLAFEGEQAQLGRVHETDFSRLGYGQSRGLAEQGYGFQLGLNEQGYYQDLGRQTNASDLDYRNQYGLNNQQFGQQMQRDAQQYEYTMSQQFMQGWFGDDPAFRDPEVINNAWAFFSGPTFRRRSSFFQGG